LNLGNCLFSGLEQVFEAAESSSWSGVAEHVTVDHVDILAPDPTRSTYALRFTNSILSRLYNLTPPPTANSSVGGDHNGFDANTPQFGLNTVVDSGADSRSPLSEIQTPADILSPTTRAYTTCVPARLSSASVRPSSACLCNPRCPALPAR
jgi:hypothetical protein